MLQPILDSDAVAEKPFRLTSAGRAQSGRRRFNPAPNPIVCRKSYPISVRYGQRETERR